MSFFQKLQKQKPVIKVVAAILLSQGKILIGRRRDDDTSGGLWEFPGGKIEKGETPEDALLREIEEELGVPSVIGDTFDVHSFSTPKRVIHLESFWTVPLKEITHFTEHSEVKWVSVEELPKHEFVFGDHPFLKKLMSYTPNELIQIERQLKK